ncbi:hypothetical protein GCM10018987_47380 [Streptomyces cremeus]
MVEGREGFRAGCGERVQRAVTPAPLQEAEQGAARRYDWFEHGKRPHIKLSTQPGKRAVPTRCANMPGRPSQSSA